MVSTKNWWCDFESYCRTQPGGRERASSSMLRRAEIGMPLRDLEGTSRWEEVVGFWVVGAEEEVASSYGGGGSDGVGCDLDILLPSMIFLAYMPRIVFKVAII